MNKNILLVANWDSNVGYAWWLMENFWATLARKFTPLDHHCVLIYPSISAIPKIIQDSPIEVLQHDFDNHGFCSNLALCRLIRNKNIGYIYLSDKQETSFFYLLFRICGVRKIIIHDHTPGERSLLSGIKKPLKKLLKKLPFINADAYIAVTEYVKQRMIHSSGLPANKCFVARNGIEPIGRDIRFQNYAKDQFNLPHDSTLIITTGRANFYKRIDFIIKAFAKVLSEIRDPNLYFIYCGDGPHLADFKQLSDELGLNKRFIFAGNRTDVRLLLQSCNIGVQASRGEVGYSLSILEYMSAGLATLVPDNPSVCQSIKHNDNGLIFEEDDLTSLTNCLKYLLSEPATQKRLGDSAIHTVSSQYSLSLTNLDLVNIFSNILKSSTTKESAQV